MPRRTSRLSTSATPALADVTGHETADDSMSLDVPEQLLTPEASRSETSSNNENASSEEKPPTRRRSTRVVRASLRATEALENAPVKNDDTATSSSQAYVDSLAKAKRSRSSLRHSIAVMESSLRKGTALPSDDAVTEDTAMAPDTPVSNSSQEPQTEDMATSLQQRTLRKRVEKALATDEETPKAKATAHNDSTGSVRRSSRLSMVGKASDMLERANSVLGKRTRNPNEVGKDLGRRASLRPRKVASPEKEEQPGPAKTVSTSKKRRASESDLSNLQSKDASLSEEPTTVTTVPKKRKKIWMTHGLYMGRESSGSRAKQRKSRNSAKTIDELADLRKLPFPMFASARLFNQRQDFKLPFNIFSPLPPGQPKPNEWRKTNKNVFVGDAAKEWRANKKLELSTCMCEEETGCDENCQNRYMFYECDSSNCRLGPECGNRNFSELKKRTKAGSKYHIGVEVIKTPDRGYGVRSNRTFEPNQIIVEYTGEIITQSECERRMRTVYKNNDCYYLMYFDQNMIIDATRGSIARFVNHSCEPNCRMEKWTVAGKPRMALFAGENGIMTGEELSYDYNFDPYSNKNVQQCRCGSEKCRGILGPRPKDKEQRIKVMDEKKTTGGSKPAKKIAGAKRKLAEETGSTMSRQGKKRRLLTPKSIKAGVKKAVSKATAARGKAAARKTTAAKTGRCKAATPNNVRLPAVKGTTRVKATVRKPAGTKGKTKTTPTSPAKTTQLKRPSAETKKQILAAAAKGSKCPPRKSPARSQAQTKRPRKPAARKAPSKSPVKARMAPSKAKSAASASSPSKGKAVKGKGLTGTMRSAAKSVARSVRGTKK